MRATNNLVLCAAMLTLSFVAAPSPQADATGRPDDPPPSSTTIARPDATTSADDASVAPAPKVEKVQPTLGQRVESAGDHELTVEITSSSSVAAAVAAVGGTLVREYQGLALAKVRASRLRSLAADPTVTSIREPLDVGSSMPAQLARPERGTMHLVPALGSGRGQKVGIIGLFDPALLATEIASGEVPPLPTDHTTCISAGAICPFGTVDADYGNAIVEVVADTAPLADLYLAELGGGMDYLLVIDWMAAHGVTTLVHYWSNPYDGPGDGTGFSAGVIDYAVSKGILWINAAGEQGADPMYTYFSGPHWRGYWSDTDNDRWLNFKGSDESETAYCGSLVGLRWSDWAASKTDYDLYITDFRASSNVAVFPVATSTPASGLNQATGGAWPIEGNDFRWLCNHDPARGPVYDVNGDNYVSLWVYRAKRSVQSPTNDVLEISVLNGWLEHANSVASAAVPFADTKNAGALVVGAFLDGNTKAWWNSQGPTNDLRQRPDLAIETCLPISFVPYTNASDCSDALLDTAGPSAILAGFAAVAADSIGATKPSDRARWITDQVRLQASAYWPRSVSWGWGPFIPSIAVPDAAPTTSPAPLHLLANPVRILETRPASGLVGTTTPGPLAPDSSISLALAGQNFSEGDVALLNVTMVKPPTGGWAQVYPPRLSFVGASSNLNVASIGATVPNLVAVRVDKNAQVALYTYGGGHFVVDLLGKFGSRYYDPSQNGHYVGLSPYKVADTTTCVGIPTGCTGSPLGGGSSLTIPLGGTSESGNPSNGIPTDGTYAAVVSVTATPGAVAGWASALPGGSTGVPSTSTLNFSANKAVSNMAVVPISTTNGSMRLFTYAPAHFRVDVLGYFRVESSPTDAAGLFVSGAPTRLLDTRTVGNTPVAAGSATVVDLAHNGEWTGTQDVWLNLTSTKAQGAGALQVSATAATPIGNHLNLSVGAANETVASSVITRVSQRAAVVGNTMPTHVIADLMGWFTPPPPGPLPPGQIELLARADGTELGSNLTVRGASADGQVLLIGGTVNEPGLVAGSTLTRWNRADDTFTSVDTTTAGVPFDTQADSMRLVQLSADGSTVLIQTDQNNLVPGDNDNARDLFAKRLDGTLEIVSVSSAEGHSNVNLLLFGLSADGQRVLFRTVGPAPELGGGQHFVRDRVAGTTTSIEDQLSIGSGDVVNRAWLAADGVHAAVIVAPASGPSAGFASVAFLDLDANVSRLVPYAITENYSPPPSSTYLKWISPDGSTVHLGSSFISSDGSFSPTAAPTDLITGDAQLAFAPIGSAPSTTAFLVTADGGPINVYRTPSGDPPNSSWVYAARLTLDGSTVFFTSAATNLGPVVSPGNHLYLYHVDF